MTESIASRSQITLKTSTQIFSRRLPMGALLFSLLLSGCTWQLPKPKSSSKQEGSQTQNSIGKPLESSKNESSSRVKRLLLEAEGAIYQQRLTTPVDDNAYLRFLQVLAEEPSNPIAIDGLNRIVETYVEWSMKATQTGNFSKAASMLNKARSVDDQHPSVIALDQKIAKAQSQQSDQHYLSKTDLLNRAPQLRFQLQELARLAQRSSARIKIIAKSDADGRWIYQQMNMATENRIRANLAIGSDPIVQLIHP